MLSWYKYIIFYLQHLECPIHLEKSKEISLRLIVIKNCILQENIYWKDPICILLNCVVEEKTEVIVNEFHKGTCRGHHAWKVASHMILRGGFY
jgi:hypothetical protein